MVANSDFGSVGVFAEGEEIMVNGNASVQSWTALGS